MSHRPIGASPRPRTMPPPKLLSTGNRRAYDAQGFTVKLAACGGMYAGEGIGFLAGGDAHILGASLLGTAIIHVWWTLRYRRSQR